MPTTLPPSIVRSSGYYGKDWPASGAIPEKFSSGKWTIQSRGFPQQTFLGASIRSFTANGGFGDTTSTLSVELVADEYNRSDLTLAGQGDDVYHSGQYDKFAPPIVGSPVFFKFGTCFASIEDAYRRTFDDLYNNGISTYSSNVSFPNIDTQSSNYDPANFNTLPNNKLVDLSNNTFSAIPQDQKQNHFVFGGILQSYTQNRGPGGSPLYSVQVVDPREILSNVTLILNNYAGTTFKNDNILNVYGFLEYNPTSGTIANIKTSLPQESKLTKQITLDITNNVSNIWFSGNDTFYTTKNHTPSAPYYLSSSFPITGTGFSRRGPQGMPFYRLKHAVSGLMQLNGALPPEYIEKGFGGLINFRGFNYVVDFGSLPSLPDFYYIDYDQINLLDLALEICDATSRELFVTLLPVINHPSCQFLYNYNNSIINSTSSFGPNLGLQPSGLVAGIIRIDTIDRSTQPAYGSIKSYIDNLASAGIYVENQDVGFELSNITTDKFIVGAQEIDMHFFSANADRDTLDVNKQRNGENTNLLPEGYQWKLESSLEQQILPYYGMLGGKAVTIPKGFGPFQQILLDTTGLSANGVGNYYVATEMELRCCLISYDKWKEFLQMYNDIYLESLEFDDTEESAALLSATNPDPAKFPPIQDISNNYGITVPRSVFTHYDAYALGDDGLPRSPCNPPYGYPLYYKRMTKLGIPEAGLTEISTRFTTAITNLARLKSADSQNFKQIIQSELTRLKDLKENSTLSSFEISYYEELEESLKSASSSDDIAKSIVLIEEAIDKASPSFVSADLSRMAKKNIQNAMKVYNFLRGVAEECLGKKFLVKIPKKVNLKYKDEITYRSSKEIEYDEGPFGFKPRPINPTPNYEFSTAFIDMIKSEANNIVTSNTMKAFLSSDTSTNSIGNYTGALRGNYNPISEEHEFNYQPTELGGFYNFDIYQNIPPGIINDLRRRQASAKFINLPTSVKQCLVPMDLSNFVNEQGRISAYVRFDESQYLSLDNIDSESFTQQTITAEGMIPDFCEALDNVNPVGNEWHSFPPENINNNSLEENKDNSEQNKNQNPKPPKSVAFVKCSVSEKLYMPPKTSYENVDVHAQHCKELKVFVPPRKIYDACTDTYKDSFSYYKTKFVPDPHGSQDKVKILNFVAGSGDMFDLIETSVDNLDTENVYALITLPQRVIPTKDGRFRDGPIQSANAEKFKHYMTMDVVKGLEGFGKINDKEAIYNKPIVGSTDILSRRLYKISNDVRVNAFLAAKKAVDSSISFGFPKVLEASFPSPVYPDLVVLPLMSKDRCYGPWISSQLDGSANAFTGIGGRIEFIKDENLSPWNYGGYDLMNNAGRLQAQFSNSLLLFSERGGFVFPGAPSGNSLCKALKTGGPLVTNIQVDVSEGGIKTTYKLDLYTSSFGKLQKQKQDNISKISRERQKLKDERNALIRKGLGKSQANINYQTEYDKLNQQISSQTPVMTQLVATASQFNQNRWSSDTGEFASTDYSVQASMQTPDMMAQTMQGSLEEQALASSYQDTAAMSVSEMWTPYSNAQFHPNMPYRQNPNTDARNSFYS